jgi:phosphodiesterase/alkaline phosphatase D-like protein
MRRKRFFKASWRRKARKAYRAFAASCRSISIFSPKNWTGRFAILALVVMIAASSLVLFNSPKMVLGQTYSLTQDDWSGGSSADTVNAPSNLTGWSKYASSSGVTADAGSVSLTPSQSNFSETFTGSSYKDADNTTANWNTSGGQLEMPVVSAAVNANVAATLNGPCNFGTSTGTPYTNAQEFVSSTGIIYIAAANNKFCMYDTASGTATDLTTVTGWNLMAQIYDMEYVPSNGRLYMGGAYTNARFGYYEPGSPGSITDLAVSSGVRSILTGDGAYAMAYDSTHERLYLGSSQGRLIAYDIATNTATNITVTSNLSSFWSTNSIYSMAFDSTNGKLYLGGYYSAAELATNADPTLDAATNIYTSLAAAWGGLSTVYSVVFNSTNGKTYWGGVQNVGPKIASFTPGSPGSFTNMTTSSGLTSFWPNYGVGGMALNNDNTTLYIGGFASNFASLNIGSGIATNLRTSSGLSTFWPSTSTEGVLDMIFDTIASKVYLLGAYGRYAVFDQGNGTATDLKTAVNGLGHNSSWNYGYTVDTAHNIAYFIDSINQFYSYDLASGTVTNLSVSTGFTSAWNSTYATHALVYVPSTGDIYIGGYGANLCVYTPGGSVTNLKTALGLASIFTQPGDGINKMLLDEANSKIYLGGGTYGVFAVYSIGSPGSVTNLTTTSSFNTTFGANIVLSMVLNSNNGKIYVGGGDSGVFSFVSYDPVSGQTANLTSTGFGANWTVNPVTAMAYHPVNHNIYLGGTNKFGVYEPGDPGTSTYLMSTSGLVSFMNTSLDSMNYNPSDGNIYIVGGNGKVAKYVPGSPGTATDFAVATNLSAIFSTSEITHAFFNPNNSRLYLSDSTMTKFGYIPMPCGTCYAFSLTADSTSQNIASATLTKNDTPGTGTVTYQLSNNGGADYATVTPGVLYNFATAGSDLRFKITITGNATVQDVSVAYNYMPTSGSLTSSKFDSLDATTIVNTLTWDEDASLPAGTTVTVSIRTADSSANLSGAWTDLTNGSANCSKVGTTVTCGATALPSEMQDGSGDRWFQYKIAMASTGAATAAVPSVAIQFVINAAPEVRNVTAVQNTNGTVTISYEVRDIDTQYGSPANQDHIHPMFEYWNGSTYETITTLAAGDTDEKAVAHDGSWNSVAYTATWTPATDYPGHYQNNTAKIRVTANDNEGANPTGSAESPTYTLDTLTPASNSVTVDASTTPATVHLASLDDSAVTMKVSATDPTLASTPSEPFSATKAMTLTEGQTVYAKFIDAYNNSTNILTAAIPATPTAVMIQDASNVISEPHVYRLFLAWKVVAGSFASYRVHRSTSLDNPASWPEIGSPITSQSTNYYVDNDVAGDGTTYYYYVETVDPSDNVSFRSLVVNGIPDGAQSGGEGGGGIGPPPVITAISHGTPKSTEATITWDTDTLSNSVVGFSTSPSTFTNTVTVGSLVNNAAGVGGHSVIITGLLPETTYYYRVSSTDIYDQTTADANGVTGYSFTTPGGPIISNTAIEQTTNTTARISWATNMSATTQLIHSIHADMSEPTVTTGTSDPTPTHIVNLTNLTAGTKYFFYVKSVAGINETVDKNVVNGVPQYYAFTTTSDATPPTISDVSVRLQPTSADIIWTTNELADSQVEFGLTNAYGTTTTLDSTATTRHVVTITGLTAQTAYHYRIKTRDINSVLATGSDMTFTTLPAGDATPPVISDIMLSSLSLNSASINWTTDETATSYLDYGTTTGLGSSFGSDTLTTLHSVTLDALSGGQTYYYRVRSVDAAGNSTIDNNSGNFYSFMTAADSTPPVISNPDDIILMNSFRALWSTNELADSQIEYGLDTGYGSTTTLDDSLVLDHAVTVSALSAATAYHYRIKTRDASGNLTTGPDRVVTTANQADNDPPVISVVASSSIGRTTATVTWTTDEESGSEVQYGPNLTYGYSMTNINDNTQSHTVELTGLTPGTEYFFKVISTDGSGNIASDDHGGVGYSFTTIIDSDPPVITGVAAALVADVSAVITWSTDEASTSQVIYGTTTAYGSQTSVYPTLTTSHSVTIQGLTKQTLYYYKVVSTDAYTNSTTDDNAGQGHTFTTTDQPGVVARSHGPQPDIIPPTIQNLRVSSIGKTSAIVEWNTDEAADTILKFGTTIAYGTLAGSVDEKIMAHQVNLAGLTSATIYHFIAVSTDASGNQGATSDRTFATLNEDGTTIPNAPLQPEGEEPPPAGNDNANANTPPELPPETPAITNPILISMNALKEIVDKLISNPAEQTSADAFTQTINELANRVISPPSIVGIAPRVDVTGTVATVSWTTDKKASSAIAFSTEADYDSGKSEPYPLLASTPGEFSTIHGVTLTNLQPATKYHFQVRSKGLVGGEAKSLDATFQTTSDLPVISDFRVAEVKDLEAILTWTTNVPTTTEVRFKNNSTGDELTQGDTAFLRDHKFQLKNLSSGATYTVVINAQDEFENQTSSRPLVVSTSMDTTPPAISKVSSSSTLYPGKESRVQTIISWDTEEPATSHVFYQEGLSKDAEKVELPLDSTLVTAHTVVVTKFRPMTVYKFHVESSDAAGNASKSNDFLILTPQQKASVLDIIIANFEQVFGWTKQLK